MDGAGASVSNAAGTIPAAAVSSPETPQWCFQRLSLGGAGHFAEKRTVSVAERDTVHTTGVTECIYTSMHQITPFAAWDIRIRQNTGPRHTPPKICTNSLSQSTMEPSAYNIP